jgi:hypothetical protein
MPGAGFKRLALKSVETSRRLYDLPFEWTQEQIRRGEAHSSFVHDLLSAGVVSEQEFDWIKCAAASIYGGPYIQNIGDP